MRQSDQTQAGLPAASTPDSLQICAHCQRYTPFTAAILAGKPLNVVCTCALERRIMDNMSYKISGLTRVEGH